MASICPYDGRRCGDCFHYREEEGRMVCFVDSDESTESAVTLKKIEVVRKLEDLLKGCCGELKHLEYKKKDGDETVDIICKNGYTYSVDVTADSYTTMIKEVMGVVANKL